MSIVTEYLRVLDWIELAPVAIEAAPVRSFAGTAGVGRHVSLDNSQRTCVVCEQQSI